METLLKEFVTGNVYLSKQLFHTVTGIKRNLIRKIKVRCHFQNITSWICTGAIIHIWLKRVVSL